MSASELAAMHQALAALVAAAEVVAESAPGAECWNLLCDAAEAAAIEVPADVLERARAEARARAED